MLKFVPMHLLPVALLLFALYLLPGNANNYYDRQRTFHVRPSNGPVSFNTNTRISANSGNISTRFPVARRKNLNRNDPRDCKERREGRPYCLKVPNYAQITRLDKIDKKEFARFAPLFNEDLVEFPKITPRIAGEFEDVYHCTSKTKTIFPQQAETSNGGWMFVVNTNQYKQGLTVELCQGEGKTCDFSTAIANRYSAVCKQHYIHRILVALAPNNTMTTQYFKIPACCKCALTQYRK